MIDSAPVGDATVDPGTSFRWGRLPDAREGAGGASIVQQSGACGRLLQASAGLLSVQAEVAQQLVCQAASDGAFASPSWRS